MPFTSGSWLVDLLGVVIALIAIGYAYFKWTYQYWKNRNVPYMEPTVPFGNFQNPLTRTVSVGAITHRIYKYMKEKGWKHGGFYILASPVWLVLDLELLKNVMTKDFNHFVDRGFYTNEKDDPLNKQSPIDKDEDRAPLVECDELNKNSAHLFAIGGKKWRNLRMKLTPTFTSGKLKAMFGTLVNCGLALEKYIEGRVDENEPVDIKNVLGCFSTDIIGSCAFGLECNSFKEPDSLFRKHGRRIFLTSRFENLKNTFSFNFPNISRALGLRLLKKDVSDFFIKIVEDTVSYREKNNFVRKDFLQLLIDIKNNKDLQEYGHKGDGKTLTMTEVAAQSFVFFVAGFETSSTTMTFALFELASNPDIQDKVREEINDVLGKHNNQITYESLSDLKYMKQVIDETLRKYPAISFVTRVCVEDYKVPGEDIIIEKGTKVFIPILGIHYDESYYQNPNVFDPERFNEENKARRHHYAHLPFGEGPRLCIGERFGIMQTKVGLTCLLRNSKVTVNEKTKVPLKMTPNSFITSAEGEIWLNIEKL